MCLGIITEIVDFHIYSEISDTRLLEIVTWLEENFHSIQKGFIDTELLKGRENSQWIMVQHWLSKEDALASSRLMMKSPLTEEFRKAIIPSSVKMSMLEQIAVWNNHK